MSPVGFILTQPAGRSSFSGSRTHIGSLGHEPHNYATFYSQVNDIPAYLAKAQALGGKTLVPPVTIPAGTFAWFADPDGTIIGLCTPKAG